MSLAQRRRLVPTLIVPDEQTWTVHGQDPAGLGAEPSFRAAATAAVLLPEGLPEQLSDPLEAYLAELAGEEPVTRRDLALPGGHEHESADEHAGHGDDNDEGGHDHTEGHGDHDHGDMMAIVGEPSADGLVMEPIELRYGPLAVPFPGGLAVDATLDGEVVSEASLSGLTTTAEQHAAAPSVPDPLAPTAWRITISRACGSDGLPGETVAVLELERAISHLAWLRSLSRLLGWRRMIDRTAGALAELSAIGPIAAANPEALDEAARLTGRILAVVRGSRTLRLRLAGLGVVAPGRAERLGLDGPNARASGLERDRRIDDPLYAELGFVPMLDTRGDAAARTLLRASEAAQSIGLAQAAMAMGARRNGADADQEDAIVEGPRGALRAAHVGGGLALSTPGGAVAGSLAAEAMVGESWDDALAILSSFDLSPWELAP